MGKKPKQDAWSHRRAVIHASLVFVGLTIVYLTVWAPNDGLRAQIAQGLLDMGTWVILGYTGGGIVDDHLKRGGFNVFKRKGDPMDGPGGNSSGGSGVGGISPPQ